MNAVCFFNLLLQIGGIQLVGLERFEDYLFSSGIDWSSSSPGRFQFRILLDLFECGDELVRPLSCSLKIPSDTSNRFLFQPLPNDSLDIPLVNLITSIFRCNVKWFWDRTAHKQDEKVRFLWLILWVYPHETAKNPSLLHCLKWTELLNTTDNNIHQGRPSRIYWKTDCFITLYREKYLIT